LIVARSPRTHSTPDQRIVVPGYPNLSEFSREYEALLKAETGGVWQSYFQRGNWRLVFPFTRREQAGAARDLMKALDTGHPQAVHLVCFPAQTINHVLLAFDYRLTDGRIEFQAYDPNRPGVPATLTFQQAPRQFELQPNNYFAGGKVNVYRIYRGWFY
jgi:hypothetical protein